MDRSSAGLGSQTATHSMKVNTTGDGFLATFDGPARAIRCAISIREELRQLGECELLGDDIGGVAVHIGARVEAKAMPGDVLVYSTVKDLVVGSGLQFEDRGTHTIKGIPDEWHLFAVAN